MAWYAASLPTSPPPPPPSFSLHISCVLFIPLDFRLLLIPRSKSLRAVILWGMTTLTDGVHRTPTTFTMRLLTTKMEPVTLPMGGGEMTANHVLGLVRGDDSVFVEWGANKQTIIDLKPSKCVFRMLDNSECNLLCCRRNTSSC
jgi:hypothetical protein